MVRLALLSLTLVVASAAAQTRLAGQSLTGATTFDITMNTTFVVPNGNNALERLRIYHALPTPRPWSPKGAKIGASDLRFTPTSAVQEHHNNTDSEYLLYTVEGKLPAGSKHSFRSEFRVVSYLRDFNPSSVKVAWKDYATPPKDTSAVVDADVTKSIHPDLAKLADDFKKKHAPPQAVLAMCQWIKTNLRYDATVTFPTSDTNAILRAKCGHCGHQQAIFAQLVTHAKIPMRHVAGLNLYSPTGKTGSLATVRSDFVNIHTWAEVYFPNVGWIEVDPGQGDKAFRLEASLIQNNRSFQNYAIWFRENGKDKMPTWTTRAGGFNSDYGVEHTISYSNRNAKK